MGSTETLGARHFLWNYSRKAANICEDLCTIDAPAAIRPRRPDLIAARSPFQDERAKDALSKILQAFISKELQPWVRTFPEDFYKELFRLRGLEYPTLTVKRPQYFGILTNDVVYRRLAPAVLEELKRVTPRSDNGRYKDKFFQRLTSNVGYPKLREHLGSVVTLMKLSDHWSDFMEKVDRIHPHYNQQIPLSLNYDAESDDGQGL